MAFEENRGIAELGSVLSQRTREQISNASKMPLDYGEIDGEYNLTTNNFPQKIPPSDYVVLRHLVERELKYEVNGTCSVPEAGNGTCKAKIDYKTRFLQPGDRVLVGRIGNEFCVLDVIVQAEKLQEEGVEL